MRVDGERRIGGLHRLRIVALGRNQTRALQQCTRIRGRGLQRGGEAAFGTRVVLAPHLRAREQSEASYGRQSRVGGQQGSRLGKVLAGEQDLGAQLHLLPGIRARLEGAIHLHLGVFREAHSPVQARGGQQHATIGWALQQSLLQLDARGAVVTLGHVALGPADPDTRGYEGIPCRGPVENRCEQRQSAPDRPRGHPYSSRRDELGAGTASAAAPRLGSLCIHNNELSRSNQLPGSAGAPGRRGIACARALLCRAQKSRTSPRAASQFSPQRAPTPMTPLPLGPVRVRAP